MPQASTPHASFEAVATRSRMRADASKARAGTGKGDSNAMRAMLQFGLDTASQ